jgi:metallo-beta-lactamase family protein
MPKNNLTANSTTVTFWGAARTVTGSMHLVEAGRQKMLLDCGLFQGHRAEAWHRNKEFPFNPSDIDLVLLSHAHIDHCGNLPHLVRRGFRGPIYCTPATRDLTALMLADSAKIQEEDASHLNRHHRPGDPEIQPLYDQRDVRRTMQLMRSVPYQAVHEIGKEISVRFEDAGHLLGSAMVHLTAGPRSITFTGDLGRKNMPILRDPEPIPPADLLVSECTYGARNHPGVEMLAGDLGAAVQRTFARGGKTLIPAFSMGRTQTIVYFLHQLVAAGQLPRLPIYVDSPLSAAATEVFRLHPECFDEETSELLYKDRDLFGEKLVRFIHSVEESKALNSRDDPCIIISASGMCESGRILHHLRHNIEDARNTILIIGFQAPETLGRRLVEKRPEVRILNAVCQLKAEVVVMNGFSGHAGRDDLLAMLTPLADPNRKLRLVHGDPEQAEALLQTLQERGFVDIAYPERGASVILD